MPTALLAGAFGQGNLGDEALLQAFASALPEWRMVATTSDRDATVRGEVSPEPTEYEGVPARRPFAVAGQASASDAVIIGGGTVFKMLNGTSGRRPHGLLANASALVGAASLMGRPVAMVGVGAGLLQGPRALAYTRFLVRHSDLLILRDEESAEKLTAAGVSGPFRVGADPAWTLLEPPESSPSALTPRVLIIPSREAAHCFGGHRRLIEFLVVAIRNIRASGLEVWLQAWQRAPAGGTDDVAIVRELERRLGSEVQVLPTPSALVDAAQAMKDVGCVLCFRFHALIAAGSAGTPAVAVAHEPKLAGLSRRLDQPAVEATIQAERLADMVVASVGALGPAPAVVKNEIERAEEGFRLLRIFLAGGTHESDQMGALPLVSWPD